MSDEKPKVVAFDYQKGDRWVTAVHVICERCGQNMPPGTKIEATSGPRSGGFFAHADGCPEKPDGE